MHRVWAQVFFCLILSRGIPAPAQSTNAAISGNVLDPAGAVVPNAMITALNTQTGVMTTTTTNDAGIYGFPSIQPGLYRLTADAPSFQTYMLKDVTVEIGARININFSLVLTGPQPSSRLYAADRRF